MTNSKIVSITVIEKAATSSWDSSAVTSCEQNRGERASRGTRVSEPRGADGKPPHSVELADADGRRPPIDSSPLLSGTHLDDLIRERVFPGRIRDVRLHQGVAHAVQRLRGVVEHMTPPRGPLHDRNRPRNHPTPPTTAADARGSVTPRAVDRSAARLNPSRTQMKEGRSAASSSFERVCDTPSGNARPGCCDISPRRRPDGRIKSRNFMNS